MNEYTGGDFDDVFAEKWYKDWRSSEEDERDPDGPDNPLFSREESKHKNHCRVVPQSEMMVAKVDPECDCIACAGQRPLLPSTREPCNEREMWFNYKSCWCENCEELQDILEA